MTHRSTALPLPLVLQPDAVRGFVALRLVDAAALALRAVAVLLLLSPVLAAAILLASFLTA